MNQLDRPIASNTFDNLPPYSADAETRLLGSLMRLGNTDDDSRRVWADIRAQVTPESFYEPGAGIVFRIMSEMLAADRLIDPRTVRDALEGKKLLDTVGGHAYIAEAWASVPNGINTFEYVRTVRKL